MEPLKEMFNESFYRRFASAFLKADANFDAEAFVKDVTRNMESFSLNGRLRNTSVVLHQHMDRDFESSLPVLYAAAPLLPRGYTALVLPDFVSLYGQEHFDISMQALRDFTSMGSSEFGVRTFIKADPKRALTIMGRWAKDPDVHVRRLASEGSRPRLPWSFKLDAVIQDPSLTRSILEELKADQELYVRKSVANHLNDYSKDNVDYLLALLKDWDVKHIHTGWIMKHASRSLIKKGSLAALELFGFAGGAHVEVKELSLKQEVLRLGDTLTFGFTLKSNESETRKLVVDYAIHYVKSAGSASKKVFKLKEVEMLPGQTMSIVKSQVIKDFTTRKHYRGKHLLEIMVNGVVMCATNFEIVI
ncbi:DNA alkylation repair protein [Pedobacter duraquae]|uniref:3-methyladenine DNA glycosylase AlkC n=1 Tax=Pedobacter duraquae TaxID=425511 RepID=A0A4R6IKK4_9SPHI|nr:DNA alkylation repair protein [Pedobacter duraquae]TDO22609.1 3-methyladenine DNA glycosylase AlkC [Pedobacter duraquae]